MLLKFILVALALARGKGKGGGSHSSSDSASDSSDVDVVDPCRAVEDADMQTYLQTLLGAFDEATSDLKLYCHMHTYEEFPDCPAVEEEVVEDDNADDGAQRRNLKSRRGGNLARFEMTTGTTDYIQMRVKQEEGDDTYVCYEGDQVKLSVDSVTYDWVTQRRSLGRSDVEATMLVTQSSTEFSDCGVQHELSCYIPRRGLTVEGETCTATQMDCRTTTRGSDTKIKMMCFTDEAEYNDHFGDADDCPAPVDDGTDDTTGGDGSVDGGDEGTGDDAVDGGETVTLALP